LNSAARPNSTRPSPNSETKPLACRATSRSWADLDRFYAAVAATGQRLDIVFADAAAATAGDK
jgi:hypothetical protein